jgi:hypothetical protein
MIMRISWQSLTVGTEICVIADGTFVAIAFDVTSFVLAERPITTNKVVNGA